MSTRRVLRSYQRKALYKSLLVNHTALFLDMRLGKSVVTLRNLEARFCRKFRALIVCPYSAMNSWIDEIRKERYTENDISLLVGKREERLSALRRQVNFHIINKEGWRVIPEIAAILWDAVVLDESTFIKAPPKMKYSDRYGKRMNTSKFFTENFRHVKHRFVLTGMPMPESELDIFMQIEFLDESILPFDNFWSFRHSLFVQLPNHEYYIKEEGKRLLKERLSNNCIFLSRKDVQIDTDKIYQKRFVKFTDDIRRIYNNLIRNYVLEKDGRIIDVTDFAVAKFVWARQLCGGFIIDRETSTSELVYKGKIDELIELVNGELSEEKVIIWAEFTLEIDLIMENLELRTKRKAAFINGYIKPLYRKEIVKGFEKGDNDILVCQPQCFQFGADLSCADIEIYYSSPLALETRIQSEDRLVSFNGKPVLIIDLIVEDTIEEDIYNSLIRKERKYEMWRRIVKRLQDKKLCR